MPKRRLKFGACRPRLLMDPLQLAAKEVIAGRSDAFRTIVEHTHVRLVQLGLRILGDRSEAEDVVQEAYVKAHQALVEGRFDQRSSIETWLYRIVTHAGIDAARRGKRVARLSRALMEVVTPPRVDPDSQIALKQLAEWLHQLPKDQYAALVLKGVEGLSTAEVAAVLECSEGSVEQRLVKARATLRQWADVGQEGACEAIFGSAQLLDRTPAGGTR
jgi:RNA polymerase sigma-70 factor, ECF subfamily